MKSIISWAIRQTPAMNTLMVAIIGVGITAGFMLRREEFPQFDLEIILIDVPYPGASPEEVETGICQKIEEAIRSVDGIKKMTSVAKEGAGNVVVEVRADVPNVQKVLSEIQSEIDRIPSFPDLAEEPEVQQVTFRTPAITVGIVAESSQAENIDLEVRDVTERVRDELLLINGISVAEIVGERAYQIDVEIPEATLRAYHLTINQVAQRIRQRNLELPGGNIRSRGETYLLRGKSKRLRGSEIAKIPLVTSPDGVVLTVGDLGTVKDEFVDTTSISMINGKPGMAIQINAGKREDLLAMADLVREYVENNNLPAGYSAVVWGDTSVNVRDRLDLLRRNGLQGLILVFLVLALFLEFRLAFWVSMGIPVSLLGACAVLLYFDQTLNMLSLFAFLIALGIVVDDAIVIGENIYAHRELGKSFHQAAVDGTLEVVPSVTMSIATTVIAFAPMFFVTGTMGKFFAVLPMAVVAMLILSLFESTFILPCHLAHGRKEPFALTAGLNRWTTRWLTRFVESIYTPVVRFSIANPMVTASVGVAIAILTVSLLTNGTVESVFFPKMDAPAVVANVTFPDGTSSRVTEEATERLEKAILEVDAAHSTEESRLVLLTHRVVGSASKEGGGGGFGGDQGGTGSHVGHVQVELADNSVRSVTSEEVLQEWRERVGDIAGLESMTFKSLTNGPAGAAIEFKLLAPVDHMSDLEAVVEETKKKLATYDGVKDVDDDSRPGKWELQLKPNADGVAMGIPLERIAHTVRASYYGEEVMRLQRGRHEVKLMVRYPEKDRQSLAGLDEIRVDAGDGIQRPITELADVDIVRGYSEINRIDQRRSITISADVDATKTNAEVVIRDLKAAFLARQLEEHPWLRIRWEGQAEQRAESISSLFTGMAIALIVMYVLLTIQFTSYWQPAIVMSVIPFGFVGAIWGHAFMGLPITLFSMLGLVALTGVVVNDSIVLVDFINARIRNGARMEDALLDAGTRRFRPVLLTSLTTIAGLLPILTERSFQAQIVIPMATSLCFGLLLATLLVLVLVPTFYSIYGRLVGIASTNTADTAIEKEEATGAYGVLS